MDPVSAHIQHTNLGVLTPFVENNEFEHLSRGAVGKITLSDQFKFEAPAGFRCSRLILIWTGIQIEVSREDENQKGLGDHHQED